MLSLMRKHATSWIIKIFIAVIGIVFVFWGLGSFKEHRAAQFAEVNDDTISMTEVTRVYQNILEQTRQRYREFLTPELLERLNLKEEAVNRIIHERLMLQEARRLQLRVTDEEVRAALNTVPVFQEAGRFDSDRYFRVLAANRISPTEYEEGQRRALLVEKVSDLVRSMAFVSESEAYARYRFENEKASIEVIEFDPARYVGAVHATDAEAEAFYLDTKDRFRRPAQAKIGYIHYRFGDFESRITFSEQEIQDYYQWHRDEFHKEKQVRARHILFKAPANASPEEEAEIKQTARDIFIQVKLLGQDFAEMARTHSEDATASKGGDLGFFGKGAMVKPFEDAAFSLEAGEISDLVRTQFGYHIIKVEEIREGGTESLDQARNKIIEKLRREQGRDQAFEMSEDGLDRAIQGTGLLEIAASGDLQYTETRYFNAEASGVPGLEQVSGLVERVFALEIGEVGPKVTAPDGYVVFKLVDKQPAVLQEFQDVREEVMDALKSEKAERAAEADAAAFLSQVLEGRGFDEMAEELVLEIFETEPFDRYGTIRELGYNPEINQAVFDLPEEGSVVERPIRNPGAFLVIRLKERSVPGLPAFEAAREEFMNRLLETKRNELLEAWLNDLKNNANITMYQKI